MAVLIPIIAIITPLLMLFGLGTYAFYYIRKNLRGLPQQQNALAQLTVAMHGAYIGTASPGEYKGTLFPQNLQFIQDCIEGRIGNYPVRFFKYFRGGRDEAITYTIFEVTIDNPIPHIYLDSKKGEFPGEPLFDRSNKLSLEGVEFGKLFNVYVQKGSEQEVLQLFEPSIMAQLIDVVPNINIEFVQDRVYFYIGAELADETILLDIYEAITKVLAKLSSELKNIGLDHEHPAKLEVLGHVRNTQIKRSPLASAMIPIVFGVGLLIYVNYIAHRQHEWNFTTVLFCGVALFTIGRAVYLYIRTGKS